MDRVEPRPVPQPAAPALSAAPSAAPSLCAPQGAAHGGSPPPASLPSDALERRLTELCGDERNLQVDFLLHLMEFDDRRAYAGAGYPSLWAYCTEVLHLREGATWRRIEAMKLLRRFPALEPPLRDGRICLTTVNQLGLVLTDENVGLLIARAAFLSKVETQRLVATVRETVDHECGAMAESQTLSLLTRAPAGGDFPDPGTGSGSMVCGNRDDEAFTGAPIADGAPAAPPVSAARAPALPSAASRTELRPLGKDAWSLRVAIDDAARAELLELAALTSHATRGDLAAVLRDAVRCALAKHRKRRGAASSERKRTRASGRAEPELPARATAGRDALPAANEPAGPAPSLDPRAIPMEVREAVWARDGGRCAWTSPVGKRCDSTWKLQLGHVRPVALGGQAKVEDLRLECATHNQYEAMRVFGRRHMARYQPSLDSRRRK